MADQKVNASTKIDEVQKEATESQEAFVQELKQFRQNQAKYGGVKETNGGLIFRLDNNQFPASSKKLKLS